MSSRWKVLVVDDSRLSRGLIKNAVEAAGMEVAGEALTGKEAIEKYDQLGPDLVTMDISMPDMDGTQATQEILKSHPDARIIIISSLSQQLLREDLLKIGAKDMVAKPFKLAELAQALQNVAANA